MKFGSVCSGIEAATEAWKGLGWKAQWYSEIEKFPSRVLAARHPETSNLGDMTKLEDSEVFRGSNINVLVGGTPCQSFSVAGLRKGLADPRGNLALVFLGIVDRKRPRWVVWENVPGVLSSWSDAEDRAPDADDEGGGGEIFGGLDAGGDPGGPRHEDVEQTNDFDTFTRGLSELGYGVAWAVLDAQHFGVPQRRQRVFVVAHLGAAAPAEAVLFDRYCLCGHPAPSRAPRERAASPIGRGASSGGGPRIDADTADNLIARTVTAGPNRQDGTADNFVTHDPMVFKPAHYTRGKDGGPSEVSPPVTAEQDRGDTHPVVLAVDITNVRFQKNDISGTIEAGQDRGNRGQGVLAPKVYSIMPQNSGRDYKAREVEVAQPLMAAGPGTGAQGGDVILDPGARTGKSTTDPRAGMGVGKDGDPMFTLQSGKQHAVTVPAYDNDVAGTLTAHHGNTKAEDAWTNKLVMSEVPEEPSPEAYDMRGNGDGKSVPTLTGHHAGAVSDFSPMVFEPRFARNGRGAPEEVCPPLKAQSGETGKGDAAPVVTTPQAFMENVRGELRTSEVTESLKGSGGKPGQGYQAAVVGAAVRRLTPRECERLQGFEDDYTLILGGDRTDDEDYAETVDYLIASGWTVAEAMALADTPDGPRYKAIGNSMCVDVMIWIGERIAAVDALLPNPI